MNYVRKPSPAWLWLLGVLALSAWGARPLWLVWRWLQTTGPGVLAAGLVVLTAWSLGRPIVRRVLPDFSKGDWVVASLLHTAIGLAILQSLAVLLGLAGGLSVLGARLLVGALALTGGMLWLRQSPHHELSGPTAAPSAVGAGALTAAAALLFTSLLEIGAPPLGPDEVQYHRRFVEALLRSGQFASDPTDPMSGIAQGMHALGALAAGVGGIGALRPLTWLLGLGALLAGERIARRTFGAPAAWIYLLVACPAASFLAVLPTFNTDLPLAFFLGVALLVALDWSMSPLRPSTRPWLLAALGGAALSTKYTAPFFFAPIYLGVGALLLARPPSSERGRGLRATVAAALLPALFALPWLLKNLLAGSHPLAPFAGFEVPPEVQTAFVFNFLDNYGGGSSTLGLLRSPGELFLFGQEFDRRLFLGRLNPWPLAALPGILLIIRGNRQAKLVLATVVGGGLLWCGLLRRVVYLLPLWPVLAALTAGGLARLVGLPSDRTARGLAPTALAALLLTVAAGEAAAPWHRHIQSASVSCGVTSWAEAEDSGSDSARSLDWLRQHTDPDDSIGFFWTWAAWDLPNRLLWLGAEDYTPLRLDLFRAGDADTVRARMAEQGVRWILVRTQFFRPETYPTLSSDEFEAGFARPAALAEEFLLEHTTLRFSDGAFRIFEIHSRGD